MPRTRRFETSDAVDLTVTLGLGAFLALLVLPIVLVREVPLEGTTVTLLLAAFTAANRSRLRCRLLRLR